MAVQGETAPQVGQLLEDGWASADIPGQEHLRCPITLGMYRDPVVVESGNTYERSAILLYWAKRGHPHDPLNNTMLSSDVMLANWDKRRQVQDYIVLRRAHCPGYIPEGWDTVNVHIPPPPATESIRPASCFPRTFFQRLVLINLVAIFIIACLIGAFLPGRAAHPMFVALAGDDLELVTEQVMRRPRDSRAQVRALEALAFFARENTENRAAILQGGGIRHIISAMGDNLEDPEVQGLGCWTLGNLASNSAENSAAITRAGGVQSIIMASQEHLTDALMQMAAFWALWNLSLRCTSSRSTIARLRGIEQILTVMKQHLRNPHVLLQACGTLWSLASDEDLREAVVQAGAIESIIEALVEHPDYEELQVQACGALRNLSLSRTLDNDVVSAFWNSKIHRAALGKTNKGLVGAPWNLDIAYAHKEWLKTLVDTPLDLLAQCRLQWNSTSDKFDNSATRVWAMGASRLVAAMDQRPRNLSMNAWLQRRLEH